ncbi:winged helix-turn-helix domain-containing protein [Streptosporangium sp. NBC_01755]|uniref:winged helix-turn-helix domain-containing protein n=1 Tax=Streptosporangium sp. NBC_01755 TaxID=2975949 RepID=UPI002DDC840D|nr:winged helix-turn-helix domain-containing protein [Streptosporangium sp. NBC_01755]WSC98382.1 winged helix-turn-helix domain-containing protein [Streptosporangium sp. NBC_01755]
MIEWRADSARWEQVARVIRKRIESGEYPPGRLISERGIVEEFGIAYTTARKVTAGLRTEGLIYTRPNYGSFVGPEPTDNE